jgi:hypothetical protein
LTSELVTNALQHGEGEVELVIRIDGRLRVEVYDQAPTMPRQLEESPLADLGRGLMLVERLSARWGAELLDPCGKKRVWFELALPPRGPCDTEHASATGQHAPSVAGQWGRRSGGSLTGMLRHGPSRVGGGGRPSRNPRRADPRSIRPRP